MKVHLTKIRSLSTHLRKDLLSMYLSLVSGGAERYIAKRRGAGGAERYIAKRWGAPSVPKGTQLSAEAEKGAKTRNP